MKISSHNEWDRLRSIVVGTAKNAHFPNYDPIYNASMEGGSWKDSPIPQGDVNWRIVEETEEDLENLVSILESLHVAVHRPKFDNFSATVSTPDWETDGQYAYCPRDTHLVVGDRVIETPMATRARQHEAIYLDHIRREAICHGAKWFSAPRPRLLTGENIVNGELKLTELEPIFDAANVCRVNNDLIYLISCSGNRQGAYWLQNILGDEYKVHVTDVYNSSHIDSTIVPISEGTVVLNGNRVNPNNIPTIFKDWDQIYIQDEDVVPRDFNGYPYASKWIGINMLAVDSQTVIVDSCQENIINTLERKNFTVIPAPLRHSRTLGGGFHCVTLDLHREN